MKISIALEITCGNHPVVAKHRSKYAPVQWKPFDDGELEELKKYQSASSKSSSANTS